MTQSGIPTARHPRIASDPKVMLGKPCIKGTRITVELILRWLSEGRTFAELLEAYPHISEDDIKAALAYAADTVGTGRPEAAE
ncbi:MAG TPA: DUF433 domain-containing protein [Hyphomicrobiaceae bacterium]|jgi:uncharacterized protein (DUF433 family)